MSMDELRIHVATVEGFNFELQGIEEISSFIIDQIEEWTWITAYPDKAGFNYGTYFMQELAHLQSLCVMVQNGSAALGDLNSAIQQRYTGPKPALFHSESPTAEAIRGIEATAGYKDALTALALVTNREPLNTNDRHSLALWMQLTIPSLSDITARDRSQAQSLATYKAHLARLRNAHEKLIERLDGESKEKLRAAESSARTIFKRSAVRNRRLMKGLEGRSETAIQEIDNTHQTYTSFMGLEAPVKYWKDKAESHRTNNIAAGFVLLVYIVIASSFLAKIYASQTTGLDSSTSPQLLIFKAVGFTAAITASFWVGRVLMKLFLSERYLANDAENRATMTKAYLALTHASAANAEDRTIILSALFRSTGDGVIHDDAPQDTAIPALISRLMTSSPR